MIIKIFKYLFDIFKFVIKPYPLEIAVVKIDPNIAIPKKILKKIPNFEDI